MKYIILSVVLLFLCVFFSKAYSYYDPSQKPNNKFGIHILFPSEIEDAARLVNSNGGEWGYVTIPIQFGDRDIEKWQKFMDDARIQKVVPVMRLSTEGDYFNTKVWRKPTASDILDFANFLNSLSWPTKNRYVIVMNEVNRSDEWGGEVPNPREYSEILSYAVEIFKSKSPDYFIIMAGLDNAAPQNGVDFFDNRVFIKKMNEADPTLFNRIDGLASHSYPNPGFSQPPNFAGSGTTEYMSEKNIIESHRNRPIPVFITETGWSSDSLSDDLISKYTRQVNEFWEKDSSVIAVTPFLMRSEGGAFDMFSYIKDGKPTNRYKSVEEQIKVKGEPEIEPVPDKEIQHQVLGRSTRTFARANNVSGKYSEFLKMYFRVVLGI